MLLHLRRLLFTSLSVFMFFSTSLYSSEMTQEERNALAAKLVPIVMFLLADEAETTVPLKKTGQVISYYPNDDGDYQMGVIPNYSRDDATEVVTDHITGLEWQDDAEAKTVLKNWEDAQTYCSALGLDGGGWRLPTVQELQGIVVDGAYNPSIDTNAFVNYSTSYDYWSSTTYAHYTSHAWIVTFYNGYTSYRNKSYTNSVRCVR